MSGLPVQQPLQRHKRMFFILSDKFNFINNNANERLKKLKLSIPTLDSSECKTLMGGDGYGYDFDGGDLPELVVTADDYRPDHSDYDYQDDLLDDEQNDYDYNHDEERGNDDSDTSHSISEQELSKLIEGLEKTLSGKIVEAWEKGLIVKGDGSHKSAAYFDQGEGKIFINDLSVDSTVLAHEFTHYLQNELGMMEAQVTIQEAPILNWRQT